MSICCSSRIAERTHREWPNKARQLSNNLVRSESMKCMIYNFFPKHSVQQCQNSSFLDTVQWFQKSPAGSLHPCQWWARFPSYRILLEERLLWGLRYLCKRTLPSMTEKSEMCTKCLFFHISITHQLDNSPCAEDDAAQRQFWTANGHGWILNTMNWNIAKYLYKFYAALVLFYTPDQLKKLASPLCHMMLTAQQQARHRKQKSARVSCFRRENLNKHHSTKI